MVFFLTGEGQAMLSHSLWYLLKKRSNFCMIIIFIKSKSFKLGPIICFYLVMIIYRIYELYRSTPSFTSPQGNISEIKCLIEKVPDLVEISYFFILTCTNINNIDPLLFSYAIPPLTVKILKNHNP